MLDVRRLKVLREVARQGSFSAAAASLGYTQSAISQHIAALERESGAKLVERGGRGVRLTDGGRALVAHADAIVARLEEAEQELAAISGLRAGRLRLASFPSAGATLVPGAVAEFRSRHPEVELSLTEAEPEESLPLLRSGEVDLTLIYSHGPPQLDGGLEPVHLLEDRMHAALPKGHPAAERAQLRMRDLRDEPWVGGCADGHCRRFLDEACAAAGFEPQVAFEADDYPTMQGLVAAGVGVALLPDLAVNAGIHPDVAVRPFRGRPPARAINAVVGSGWRSPAVDAMLDILRAESAKFARPLELAS